LSTTEAEFVALSEGLRSTIPIMRLLEEMSQKEFGMLESVAGVYSRIFEENSNVLTIET